MRTVKRTRVLMGVSIAVPVNPVSNDITLPIGKGKTSIPQISVDTGLNTRSLKTICERNYLHLPEQHVRPVYLLMAQKLLCYGEKDERP